MHIGGLKWLWVSVLVLALDLLTKYLASTYLTFLVPEPVFAAFNAGFNLTLMHNTGAAFSFLSEASGWQRWFFSIIALAVSVGILVWLKRLANTQVLLSIALTLILGGALGNLWDRITLGYVVDFIQLYYDRWSWPAFNVADSAITVGAVLLVIDSFRGGKNPGQAVTR